MTRHLAAWLTLTVLLTGCFAKIYELPSQPETADALFPPLPDQDFMVGLAVSGGGSRAATFAAGALEALAELPVRLGSETVAPVARGLAKRKIPFFFYTGQSHDDPIRHEWPTSQIISKPARPGSLIAAVAALVARPA